MLAMLRALRPLAALQIIPSMKLVLTGLSHAVLGLGTMAVIVMFFFVVAGLAGMQLFATYSRYRCFFNGTDASVLDAAGLAVVGANELIGSLEVLNNVDTLTQYVSADGAFPAPGGLISFASGGHHYQNCAGPWAAGSGQQCNGESFFNRTGNLTAAAYKDIVCADSTVNTEHWNFDSFPWTCVTLFQLISMVSWSDIMMKTQDATGWYAVIYFVLVIVFGQFVILNLIIAVLGESYQDAIEDAAAEQRVAKEEARLLRLEKKKAKQLRAEARAVKATARRLEKKAARAEKVSERASSLASSSESEGGAGGVGRRRRVSLIASTKSSSSETEGDGAPAAANKRGGMRRAGTLSGLRSPRPSFEAEGTEGAPAAADSHERRGLSRSGTLGGLRGPRSSREALTAAAAMGAAATGAATEAAATGEAAVTTASAVTATAATAAAATAAAAMGALGAPGFLQASSPLETEGAEGAQTQGSPPPSPPSAGTTLPFPGADRRSSSETEEGAEEGAEGTTSRDHSPDPMRRAEGAEGDEGTTSRDHSPDATRRSSLHRNSTMSWEGADGDDAVKVKAKREPLLSRMDCFRKVAPQTRAKLLKLTTGMPFRVFFMVLVLANVITLSITDNDMSTEAAERAGDAPNRDNNALKTTLDNVEWLFAFFFFVEMLLKMGALGLPKYLSNGFNVLDFFIVFCSIFELFATIAGLQAADVFNALRALRVFRLFKLASNFEAMRGVISGAIESVKAVFAVTVIMLVVIFIETI